MRGCFGGTDQIPRAGTVDVPFGCKLYSGLVGSLTPARCELIDALASDCHDDSSLRVPKLLRSSCLELDCGI
jgi:hypothetical protein